MNNKRPVYTYSFKEINILYGGATYNVNGEATYSVYDEGIGDYEYWGSKEVQHNYLAEFDKVVAISSLTLVDKLEYGKQTLTEQDIVKIKQIIIEDLNDDYDLCSDIAIQTRENELSSDE